MQTKRAKREHPELPFEPVLMRPGDPLEQAALEFHLANPHVLPAIIRLCLDMKTAGHTRWGIAGAFEVLRYQVRTKSQTYRLSNSHRAYFARWIMRDVPELAGFFELRPQADR